MPTSLTLIAIPKGLSGAGALEVSLVVAPRLTGSHLLGAFPLMQGWTEILARERPGIKLRFGDAAVEATPRYDTLRPDIWLELFTAETPVEPFAFDDRSKSLVISYPTRRALDRVKESYQQTAQNPNASLRYARSALDWVEADPLKDGIAGARRRAYGAQSGQDKPIDDVWTAFSLFYRMPQPGPDAPDPLPRSPERLAAVFDFHKAVSALMAHPSLTRALGLVIDMTVPADKVAVAGTGGVPARTVAVEQFLLPAVKQRTRFQKPEVLYHHVPETVFAAADPDRRQVSNGFLTLPEQDYHLFDLDLEGAMAKLGVMKNSIERAGFATKDDGGELPALRSSGLSLAMDNQAMVTNRALVRSRDIDKGFRSPADPDALSASDLLRGYRTDVWSRSSGSWRSLHQRKASYRFGDDGRVSFDATEEGFAQPAATSPAPDPAREPQPGLPPVEDDLYVHESLVRWNGWSLSVPRPGTPLHRSNTHEPMEEDTSGDEFVTAFKLRQSFQVVPRSLPKLRFGNAYRMRIRAVDIAGNSPDFDIGESASGQPDPPITLPPGGLAHPYYRYEPVPHPVLLMRDVPESSRESLERVVIRSFNADMSLDREPSPDVEVRHVAPPRCSVELAERHGVLDDIAGALKSDGSTFADLVARNDAVTRTERLGTPPTDTPIERGPQVQVDYLPDPIARTAAMRDLPGMPPGLVSFCGDAGMVDTRRDPFGEAGPVLKVSFGDSWPQRRAFRLELVEGEGGPGWDAAGRVLTVQLPKGASKAVSLSSSMSEADLDLMGVWAWIREKITADQARLVANGAPALVFDLARHAQATEQLIRRAQEGGLWALTPSRAVRLVHAVQQPLGRPKFGCGPVQRRSDVKPGALSHDTQLSSEVGLVALRRPNSAEAVLVGSIEAHVASTGRIDIHAAWTDVEDDGTSPDGVRRRTEKSLVEPIIIGEGQVSIKAEGTGDRLVARVVDGGRLEMTPDYWSTIEEPAVAPIHRFSDTRHRMVTYTPVSASRFISDFGEASGLDFTRTGEATTIAVPNSARPRSPRIVQVLPIFGWQRERVGTVATSVRSGFGLRVYFDRPWFLTGDGERLGVLLWPYGRKKPSDIERRDKLAGRVTEWALDAARKSGRLSDMPTRADVYGHDVLMTGVSHPNGLGSIDVAGFGVNFDAERGLWFSDITLRSQNAYMPFIRLALSRFQPHSIRNAEISVPASADFIQLTPDRSAVLVADPELPGVYHIAVSGVGPEPTEHAPWRNRIEIHVERRREDLAGDLGWSPAAPSDVTVTAKSTGAGGTSALYLGVIEFAATPERGRFRLVIREFETWRADDLRLTVVPLSGPQQDETGLSGLDLSGVGRRVSARPPAARSLTERALDKIDGVLPLQRTARRLVYAEFIALEPSAFAQDESKPPIDDGPVIGGPQPDDDVAWPPFAGPGGDAFTPQWGEMPVVDEAAGEDAAGYLKLAQSMLNNTGVLPVPLELDGIFSPAVSAGVSAFRSTTGFDAAPVLDAPTWLALAVAAPFPALEMGLGGAEMTGPPVAYLQRLLNIGSAAPISETESYTPETRDRVRSFQETAGIAPTGIVDAATWDALVDLMTQMAPSGVEEVVLNFDRARWRAGQPAFEVVSRRDIEDAVLPSSQALDVNWEDSSGCWVQLSDTAGRPLYRHIVGTPLNRGVESIGGEGSQWERAPEPPETVTLVLNLPRMAAARALLIFGNVDSDDAGPAALIGQFDPW